MLLILSSFFALIALADEPNSVIISTSDSHQEINFSSLKPVTLKTINHHPQFQKQGEVEYQGYKLQDILKGNSLKPDQSIVLLGTTGEFSVELKANEVLNEDVILATHKNGQRILAKDQGNQIIYGVKAIQKFPHLKQRSYWLWWVRNIVIDRAYKNDFNDHQESMVQLESTIDFPQPDGISSMKSFVPVKILSGKILVTGKAKILKAQLINKSIIEVPIKNNFSYFLTPTNSLKAGGETLYVVEIKNNKVTNLISHIFYIQKIDLN